MSIVVHLYVYTEENVLPVWKLFFCMRDLISIHVCTSPLAVTRTAAFVASNATPLTCVAPDCMTNNRVPHDPRTHQEEEEEEGEETVQMIDPFTQKLTLYHVLCEGRSE